MTRTVITRRTFTRHESGQALVELALVAPVLLALVFGIADFCRVFYASITVSNAARAGAQYGLRTGFYNQIGGMQAAAAADAGTKFASMTVTPTFYCICGTNPITSTHYSSYAAAKTACSAMTPPVNPSIWVDVTTNYTFTTFTSFPGFPNSVALSGRAQMRAQ
jgi:Flp pilus assembly protein TadG